MYVLIEYVLKKSRISYTLSGDIYIFNAFAKLIVGSVYIYINIETLSISNHICMCVCVCIQKYIYFHKLPYMCVYINTRISMSLIIKTKQN